MSHLPYRNKCQIFSTQLRESKGKKKITEMRLLMHTQVIIAEEKLERSQCGYLPLSLPREVVVAFVENA
jgi:hypothetical protein